jgi:hypothetical protein
MEQVEPGKSPLKVIEPHKLVAGRGRKLTRLKRCYVWTRLSDPAIKEAL